MEKLQGTNTSNYDFNMGHKMTDKDGKKLKIGSIVAAKKIGKENFTLKGTIIAIEDGVVTFRLFRNESISYATAANLKRIKYNPYKEK